jgi:hypothetical protein
MTAIGNGVAFTGEVKLARKATSYEKGRSPASGTACSPTVRGKLSRHLSIVSVTHRFPDEAPEKILQSDYHHSRINVIIGISRCSNRG